MDYTGVGLDRFYCTFFAGGPLEKTTMYVSLSDHHILKFLTGNTVQES